MITTIKLNGLTCPACKKLTEKRIGQIAGVESVEVNLSDSFATISAGREISKEEISKVLEGTPYTV